MKFSLQRLVGTALNGKSTIHPIKATDRDYLFFGENYIIGHLTNAGSVPGKNAHAIAQKYKRHCLAGHDHVTGVFDPRNKHIGASIGCTASVEKFWYSEKVMNGYAFMQKGYALIDTEDSFELYGEDHEVYFSRSRMYNGIYTCTKV
jgi:hypothetical protein